MIRGAPYNVLDYGADPSGVADSTTAFLTAIGAYADKRAIYVPPGTYIVKNTIFLGINKKLYGDSSTSTIIKFDSIDQNCIQGDAYTHVEGITIQKIVLSSRTGIASHTPTIANGWRNGVVRDVVIIDFDIGIGSTQGLTQGLMFQNTYERVRIYNATTGVQMGAGSNANTWVNCEFWNCGLPVQLNNTTTQDFVCCGFEGATGTFDFSLAACDNINFDNCYFEPAKGGVFDNSTGSFVNCHITKFYDATTIFLQALNNSTVYIHDLTDYNYGGGVVTFQKFYVTFTGSVVYGVNCTTRGGGQKTENYSIDGIILDIIISGPNRVVKYGNGWQTIDVNFEQSLAPIMTGTTLSYSDTLSISPYPFVDNKFSAVASIYANTTASFLLVDSPIIAVRPTSGSTLDIAAKRNTILNVDGYFYSIHMSGFWK